MTTARPELPYPYSPQAKTRDESSPRGKLCDGIACHGKIVQHISSILSACNMQISNSETL